MSNFFDMYENAQFRNAVFNDVTFLNGHVGYSDGDIPQWLLLLETTKDKLTQKNWVVKRGTKESLDILIENEIKVSVVYEPMDITAMLKGEPFIPSVHHVSISGIRHFTTHFQNILASTINDYVREHIKDFLPNYYINHITFYTLNERDIQNGYIDANSLIVRGHLTIGKDMYVIDEVYRDKVMLPPHDELKELIILGECIPTDIGLALSYPGEWSHNIGYAHSMGKLRAQWWSQLWHI